MFRVYGIRFRFERFWSRVLGCRDFRVLGHPISLGSRV